MMLNSRSSTSISSSSVNSSQQANPWVVSIVGMGGLGKTTLAQLLFKDSNLGNFDSKAWVCVSDDFRISNILIKMIESIDNGTKHGGSSDLEALGSQISIRLNGKNFLLVLDDLWNEDSRYWGQLMDSLVCTGAKSIKILITTRSSKVGFVVGGSTYRLQRLKNDVCWSIMEKVISTRDERILALERMTTIGKDIVKRCDGLPLAADFLGSLMASNTDESHWLKIKDHINLWNTAESKRLLSNIKLSYDKLPSPLKQCFSYCSIFPKDWIIERETLTRLWMAEGFLPLTDVLNCSSIEDIGNYYFDLLLSNSLFQDVETDELGVVMTCKMHDIVHDLAMTVVDREEYGILQSREGTEDTSKVRRLQHVCSEGSSGTIPGALSKAKRLRTVAAVAPKNCSQINSFFSNKRLRVLYPLGGWDKKICTSIPKLKHLRYLDLSGCKIDSVNDIKALNRSYNLLTLVLRGCVNAWLVLRKIKSLKSLRHLDLSYSDIKALPDSTVGLTNLQHLNLSHCDKFEALPENIGLLIHLSFLDLSYTAIKRLPESITRLSNLRILEFPRDLDALPREFGALTQLRRLDVRGTEIKELPESCTRTGGNLEIVKLGGNCKFPRDIKNWPKLKHFTHERVAGDEPTPRGMENLIYLETLESYMVRKEPAQLCSESTGHRSGIEELSALNYLQVLHIHNIENLMGGKEGAERAKLKDKQHMRELYLKWSSEKKDGYLVFEGLQPHPNLRKLVIQGFQGYGLPTWITGTRSSNCLLQNLVELELLYVDIDEKLPALGMLPNLRVLRIAHGMKSTKYLGVCDIQTLLEDESSSKIGKVKLSSSIYTQPLFQSLIELKIEGMDNLEELITHRDPFLHCATCQCFASLEVLKIQGCERLRSIPLTLFSSLKELQLSSTTDKVTSLFLHPGVEGGRCLESLTSIIIVDVEDLIYLPPPLVLLQNCAPRLEYLHIYISLDARSFKVFRKIMMISTLDTLLSAYAH
ncbi:putative disease resistance protein RGA3 [Papaver somniferum]|uniref:putative disease resistance protein RGA3 n=1 Tax=Papaver somniferum TaxID=3469 RepID=UPI000E70384E|nr:putative disease resistance protein RGA3 [Papaver somniferum]